MQRLLLHSMFTICLGYFNKFVYIVRPKNDTMKNMNNYILLIPMICITVFLRSDLKFPKLFVQHPHHPVTCAHHISNFHSFEHFANALAHSCKRVCTIVCCLFLVSPQKTSRYYLLCNSCHVNGLKQLSSTCFISFTDMVFFWNVC